MSFASPTLQLMENTNALQQTLDLFANRGPMRIVSRGRAALDAAHARGYDTDGAHPDATLVLTLGAAAGPPRVDKRRLVVDLDARDAVETTKAWLANVAPRVLNISEPRKSRRAGTYGRSYAFLSRVLAKSYA